MQESGQEGSKGRRLVSTFPEFSCIRRRVSASLLNHRHRMFSSLFEVLLGVAVVERENESPQTSLQTGAISLLRFLSCLEDQVSRLPHTPILDCKQLFFGGRFLLGLGTLL